MTFYEELGVPQDAPLDTIREAYRNVARLLHPDAQTNPTLKESAEAQMKRINQLYDTLSDPERRRRYDQELAEPADHAIPVVIQTTAPAEQFHVRYAGNLAWLAATAIGAIFIVWLASRESAAPAVYPLPAPAAQSAGADRKRDDEIARLRAELSAAYADRDRLARRVAAFGVERSSQSGAIAAPIAVQPPVLVQPPTIEVALPAKIQPVPSETPRKGWSGSWVYHQGRTEGKPRSLLPPEFIQAVISEDNGWVHGQYHARFKVADPSISPEVNFHFEGRISGRDGRLTWTGADGARGEVQLKLISDTSLEMSWVASSLGTSMGLASGTAVLDRKE